MNSQNPIKHNTKNKDIRNKKRKQLEKKQFCYIIYADRVLK